MFIGVYRRKHSGAPKAKDRAVGHDVCRKAVQARGSETSSRGPQVSLPGIIRDNEKVSCWCGQRIRDAFIRLVSYVHFFSISDASGALPLPSITVWLSNRGRPSLRFHLDSPYHCNIPPPDMPLTLYQQSFLFLPISKWYHAWLRVGRKDCVVGLECWGHGIMKSSSRPEKGKIDPLCCTCIRRHVWRWLWPGRVAPPSHQVLFLL